MKEKNRECSCWPWAWLAREGGKEAKANIVDNYEETSLQLISEVSADITSGITFSITSAAGPKPQGLLVVCFNINILWSGISQYPLHSPNPVLGSRVVGWVNELDIRTGPATICKY